LPRTAYPSHINHTLGIKLPASANDRYWVGSRTSAFRPGKEDSVIPALSKHARAPLSATTWRDEQSLAGRNGVGSVSDSPRNYKEFAPSQAALDGSAVDLQQEGEFT